MGSVSPLSACVNSRCSTDLVCFSCFLWKCGGNCWRSKHRSNSHTPLTSTKCARSGSWLPILTLNPQLRTPTWTHFDSVCKTWSVNSTRHIADEHALIQCVSVRFGPWTPLTTLKMPPHQHKKRDGAPKTAWQSLWQELPNAQGRVFLARAPRWAPGWNRLMRLRCFFSVGRSVTKATYGVLLNETKMIGSLMEGWMNQEISSSSTVDRWSMLDRRHFPTMQQRSIIHRVLMRLNKCDDDDDDDDDDDEWWLPRVFFTVKNAN